MSVTLTTSLTIFGLLCVSAAKSVRNLGTSPRVKLGECDGDCDSASDCLNNKLCWQRDSGDGLPLGCEGTPGRDYDYCYAPVGKKLRSIAVNPSHKLGLCEGDCDKDSDCRGDLFCWQRDDSGGDQGLAIPPGCYGTPNSQWDYCYQPRGEYMLESIAINPQQKLPMCAGDCDRDSDCMGNLKCFQRDSQSMSFACNGEAKRPWDYCVSDLSNRYVDEIFIIMTHNSLAKVGKVGSPNQNHDLARQFRDGVRGFNLDLYMENNVVKTKHGPGNSYDPRHYVQGLMNELNKVENAGEFIIVQLQQDNSNGNVDLNAVSDWFGDKLVKNFDNHKKLGHYLKDGKQVLVFSDRRWNNGKGIHYTNEYIVENTYKWNSKWYDWLFRRRFFGVITGLFGSPFLELRGTPMDYRRGPKSGGHVIRLMNYFCCDGTGNMAKASRLHWHGTVRKNMQKYESQSYTQGKPNILMVDYYDVNNNGILGLL